MMRRVVLKAATGFVLASMVWTGGAASAAQPSLNPSSPVTFTGTFKAVLSGTLSFSPPLTNTQAHETIVTFAAKTTKVSGDLSESGSQIVGATVTADDGASIPGSSCSTIFAPTDGLVLGDQNVDYATKPGGRPANPSQLSYDPLQFSGSSVLSTKQKSPVHVEGSFQRTSASQKEYPVLRLVFDQSLSTFQSECAGAGVSQLTFSGIAGTSSLKIS